MRCTAVITQRRRKLKEMIVSRLQRPAANSATRLWHPRVSRPLCIGLSEEDPTKFRHRSMYPQRERILYSFANALHERELFGDSTRVNRDQLKDICLRAAKLQEEDVELLIDHTAGKIAGEDFTDVCLREVCAKVAELLPPPPETRKED